MQPANQDGISAADRSEDHSTLNTTATTDIWPVDARTGRTMEKYNVENLSLEASGGEYRSRMVSDGQMEFTWH